MKMHVCFETITCISLKKLSCRIDVAAGAEDEQSKTNSRRDYEQSKTIMSSRSSQDDYE